MERTNVFTESLDQKLYDVEKQFAEKRAELKQKHADNLYGDEHLGDITKLEKQYVIAKDSAYQNWKAECENTEKAAAGLILTGIIGYGLFKLGQAVARKHM